VSERKASGAEGRRPRLALIGKQGAGKGTQASRIAEHYGVSHLATGDIFRAAAREGTELGNRASQYIDLGELVPDELVIDVVREQLERDGRVLIESGFVLDGFPRTRVQAEELDRALGFDPLDVVVNIDVPTEVVLQRIAGRRVCVDCGTTYHVDSPPNDGWQCDNCGGKVVQREDDTEDAVMRRLELYELQTLPVIQYYRRSGRLENLQGDGDSDAVFEHLVEAIDHHMERDQ
jgi:adenylate kinase